MNTFPTSRRLLIGTAILFTVLPARAQIYWDWDPGQDPNGSWSDAAKWSAGVPGHLDHALVDIHPPQQWDLLLDGTFEVASFSINSNVFLRGQEPGDSHLTISGDFDWSGAWIRGPSLAVDGDVQIGDPNVPRQLLVFDCGGRCGTFTTRGTTILAPGQQAAFILGDGSLLQNEGTFLVRYRSDNTTGGVSGAGVFENKGSLVFETPQALEWIPVILNHGTLDLDGTDVTFLGSYTHLAKIANFETGTIKGTGSLNGAGVFNLEDFFLNEGSMDPGDPLGTIQIVGDYRSTNTAVVKIDVRSAGNDVIVVDGAAQLAGAIEVVTDFAPPTGQEYVVFTASGGVAGEFVSPPPGFDVRYDATQVVLIALDQTASCDITGTVRSETGLHGVTVKLLGSTGDPIPEVADQSSDAAGSYTFEDVAAGDYQVLIVEPLGYAAATNPQFATSDCQTTTVVDFSLRGFVPGNEARGRGYWKHQFDVYVTNKGKAKETAQDLADYIGIIYSRFTLPFYQTLFVGMADGVNDLAEWQDVLTTRRKPTHHDRAIGELATVLLNLTSSKVAQYHVATEDELTVGEVVTYASDLLINGDASDDGIAEELLAAVNGQQLIVAGLIPPSNRLYKAQTNGVDVPFELLQNYPNPFGRSTAIEVSLAVESEVEITVHDLLGRRLLTFAYGLLEAGSHVLPIVDDGLPSGRYIYQLTAGEFRAAKTMVVVR